MSGRNTSVTGSELPEGGTCVTKWLVQTVFGSPFLKNFPIPAALEDQSFCNGLYFPTLSRSRKQNLSLNAWTLCIRLSRCVSKGMRKDANNRSPLPAFRRIESQLETVTASSRERSRVTWTRVLARQEPHLSPLGDCGPTIHLLKANIIGRKCQNLSKMKD